MSASASACAWSSSAGTVAQTASTAFCSAATDGLTGGTTRTAGPRPVTPGTAHPAVSPGTGAAGRSVWHEHVSPLERGPTDVRQHPGRDDVRQVSIQGVVCERGNESADLRVRVLE